MEFNLRLRYNKLSFEKKALLKQKRALELKAKYIEVEMKLILKEHNNTIGTNVDNQYNLDHQLPDVINSYHIDKLLTLPDDVFQQHFLQYLQLKDIGQFDNAMTNYDYRCRYLEKISKSILKSLPLVTIDIPRLLWLKSKNLYLSNVLFDKVDIKKSTLVNTRSVFHHFENVTSINAIQANNLGVMLSHCTSLKQLKLVAKAICINSSPFIDSFILYCKRLQSLDLSECRKITDNSLILISVNCIELQRLNFHSCSYLTDQSIISIAQHCNQLQEIDLTLNNVTDEGIIALSTYCARLHKIILVDCSRITDLSIIQISKNCKELKVLKLNSCINIINTSILSLSKYCVKLECLSINYCHNITDEAIIELSKSCIGLLELGLSCCNQLTDASIISISTYCVGLKILHLFNCRNITDASIISLSQHCTALELLNLNCCSNITDESIVPLTLGCKRLRKLSLNSIAGITDKSVLTAAIVGVKELNVLDCDNVSKNLRQYFESFDELQLAIATY